MELTDILIDLSNSKAALEVANHTIRRLNGKCMRKNLVIAGLVWFGYTACKMLGKSEKKRKEAEEYSRNLEANLAREQQTVEELNRKGAEAYWTACGDGKASIDKKEV
jgi:hypothetical protein